MDGQRVPLPSLESLVVLNIACWGAGVKAWTLGAGECGAEARELLAGSPVVNFFIAVVFISSVCVSVFLSIYVFTCFCLKNNNQLFIIFIIIAFSSVFIVVLVFT